MRNIYKLFIVLVLLLISSNLFSQQWGLLTPLKEIAQVKKIEITPNGTIYLSNEVNNPLGTLARSRDGGNTWEYLLTGSVYLFDIQMLDDNYGFVLKGGHIFKTTDAFSTVEEIEVENFTAGKVLFLNYDSGYISGGQNGKIIKTTDGGQNWVFVNLNVSESINDLKFLNENVGYAATSGGKIFKTQNGGQNWELVYSQSGSINEILLYDTNTVFCVGSGGKILKSSDGADSWTVLNSNTTRRLNSIKFINNTLVAVGDYGTIVKSQSMGDNWEVETLDLLRAFTDELYFIEKFNNQILIGADSRVFESFDLENWTVFQKELYRSDLTEVHFFDHENGFIMGHDYGLVAKTDDGGKNWENAFTDITNNHQFSSMHINSNGKGILVGTDNYYRITNDYGESWTTTSLLNEYGHRKSCWRKINGDFFIGGTGTFDTMDKALRMYSGNQWIIFDEIKNVQLIKFLNDDFGIVASGKNIYKTYDGGFNWEGPIDYGGTTDINTINILDENTFYINYQFTADGGQTWTEFQRFIPEYEVYLYEYHFYTLDLGFGLDYNKALYKTTDGGETWEKMMDSSFVPNFNALESYINPDFNKVQFLDDRIIGVSSGANVYALEISGFQNYTITADVSPDSAGTITGTGTYEYGESTTLVATPNLGYTFTNWAENGEIISTDASLTIEVQANRNFVANFSLNNYNVATSSNPVVGGSTIGSGTYHYGDTANLTATANEGYTFINWTEDGNEISTDPNLVIQIHSDRNLTANFELQMSTIDPGNNQITIAPNPFDKYIRIQSKNHPFDKIELFDLSGKLIKSISAINQKDFEIQTGDLAPGVYSLRVYMKNGIETYKLIKQ